MRRALGVKPGLLNDDRIGRALDAIAPHLDQIAGSVGVAAIGAFGIDVTRMHWDMTSISVHGEYAQNEDGFATPKCGHPKDRHPDLKQVQAGIAVSGDDGIPLFHRPFDSGAGEAGQVIPVMKAQQEMATQDRLPIIPQPTPSSSGCSTCSASTHGNSADDHHVRETGLAGHANGADRMAPARPAISVVLDESGLQLDRSLALDLGHGRLDLVDRHRAE